MELREYQLDTVDKLRKHFIQTPAPRRVVVRMPTGAGKTAVLMEVARAWKRGKVIWLTHRVELINQAYHQAEQWGVAFGKLEVHTPMKLYNRIKKAREFGGEAWSGLGVDDKSLLIVDEAHHATARTWEAVIRDFPGDVIGTTATVWRLKKTEGFDHIFTDMVEGPNMLDLTKMGFLSPVKVWHVPDHEIVGSGNTGGEFNLRQTEDNVSTRANEYACAWCLDMLEEHDIPRKVIVFCLTVRHAERVAEIFTEFGCSAGIVHANSAPSDRRETVEAFGRGDIEVLCNVNICTEGFDVPDARCILMLRPTKSKALYLQMIGRGTRPVEGKEYLLVLDATGNSSEFGLPAECDAFTNWMLEQRGEKGEGGASPVKECDNCHAMVAAGCNQCPECGHELRIECNSCGRRKKRKDLEEGMCLECRMDFSSDFSKAVELLPLNLKWKYSRAGNLYATYHTDLRDYRIVVKQNKKGTSWGYMVFFGTGTSMPVMGWGCKSEENAMLKGLVQLRGMVESHLKTDGMDGHGLHDTTEGYTHERQFGMVV